MKKFFSLDKLYPASSENAKPSGTKDVSGEFSGQIPMNELTKTYSCSGGPGGQNVNKVATKVDLRWVLFYYCMCSLSSKSKCFSKRIGPEDL